MPEDTKRTSRGPSEGWTAMAALEAGLEDGAAGHQHAVEDTTPSYSDLTALSPALFPFRSLPTPAAQGDDPGEFKEPATLKVGGVGTMVGGGAWSKGSPPGEPAQRSARTPP